MRGMKGKLNNFKKGDGLKLSPFPFHTIGKLYFPIV